MRTRRASALLVPVLVLTAGLLLSGHRLLAQDDDGADLTFENRPVDRILVQLAEDGEFNVVCHRAVAGVTVTVDLSGVSPRDGLDVVVKAAGLACTEVPCPGSEKVAYFVHAADTAPAVEPVPVGTDQTLELRSESFPLANLMLGIADQYDVNVVCSHRLSGTVSMRVDGLPLGVALGLALAACDQTSTPFGVGNGRTIHIIHPLDQDLVTPYGSEWPDTPSAIKAPFSLRREGYPGANGLVGIAEQYKLNVVVEPSRASWTLRIDDVPVSAGVAAILMATGMVGDWLTGPGGRRILVVRKAGSAPLPAWRDSPVAKEMAGRTDKFSEPPGLTLAAEDHPLAWILMNAARDHRLNLAYDTAGVDGKTPPAILILNVNVAFGVWMVCAVNGCTIDVVKDARGTPVLFVRPHSAPAFDDDDFDLAGDTDTPLVEDLQFEATGLRTAVEKLVDTRPIVLQRGLDDREVSGRFHGIDRATALNLVAASAGCRVNVVPDPEGGADILFVRRTDR